MVKIRLARLGVKKRPFYRIVVADSRSPRNGKFIEKIGFFNPILPKNSRKILRFNFERLQYWKKNGASMSDRVKSLMKKSSKYLHANKELKL
ncbi:MAG: 30S ribosomal protein S16 [Buchnera aphidicola (Nurudea yanoniella)]